MARPSPRVPGAPAGFNAKIVNKDRGTIYCRIYSIQQNTSIVTRQDAASQAKTLYPQYVAEGSFAIHFQHGSSGERDRFNAWVKRYMEDASSGRLSQAYVDVSCPARRFQRRAVITGTLKYGSNIETVNRAKTTTLTFLGAADPARRSQVSRMHHAPKDLTSMYFYPAGIQTGWDTVEQVYDNPPQRPGEPNRPV